MTTTEKGSSIDPLFLFTHAVSYIFHIMDHEFH